MTELINVIKSFQELDLDTENAIKYYFVEEKFKKDEFIIREGKICTKIILLNLELFVDLP